MESAWREKGREIRGSESAPWGSPLSVGVVSEGLSDEGMPRDLAKCLRRCPETHPEASLWAQIFLSHLGQLGAPDKQVRYLEPNAQAPPQPGSHCWVLPFSWLSGLLAQFLPPKQCPLKQTQRVAQWCAGASSQWFARDNC